MMNRDKYMRGATTGAAASASRKAQRTAFYSLIIRKSSKLQKFKPDE
jgi:cobalamin biosynthesis protein CbiD